MKTNALAVLLSVLLILPNAAILSARAAESDIEVRVDGVVLETDVPPAIIDGRTMVPMRVIFEKLGAAISWEPDAKKVSAEKDGIAVKQLKAVEKIDLSSIKLPDESNEQ